MEHNQYLSEIYYILELSQNGDKRIIDPVTIDDLIKKLDQVKNKANILERDAIPIDDEIAKRYIEKFSKYFSLHPQLQKRFGVKASVFQKSFEKHQKITLRLVMDEGVYGLAYLIDGEAYFIDGIKDKPNKLYNLSQNENQFDNEFGLHLDKNVIYISNGEKTANTRKIMINYYGNFNHDFDMEGYINFIPAIIEDSSDPNNHQFTFIMYFGKKIDPASRNETISKDNVYYDTFQLCPPTC